MFRAVADEGAELRRLAVRGAGVTVFAQGTLLVVSMAATIILARLLAPADFGVVAMVATFSLLLTTFAGFTEAVLQWKEIDRFLASNLFWISVGIGVLLTIGFAASGPLMAWFYGDPRVVAIAVALSLQIFLTSISIVHQALLQRAMLFSLVAANDIVARAASVVVSIFLAFAGWGYWALVGGIIALPLSRTIGAWYLCRWMPGLPRRTPGTGTMMRYVANVYSRFSVSYFARNMDNLLVGWRFGAQPLGFYKKAYDLFAMPAALVVSPLTSVAVSALSRVKENPEQYKRYFFGALTVTAFLGMAVGADLTLIGRDLIRLLLGPGWEQSGRIFTFLGPGIGFMFLYATNSWIHLSIGTSGRFFRWGIIELVVTGLLFIGALHWGPDGIAFAWTISYAILTLPAFWYSGRPINLGVASVISTVWKYVLASVLAACLSLLALEVLPSIATVSGGLGSFLRVAETSLLFGTFYLAGVVLLHGSWAPLNLVLKLFREMLASRRLSTPPPAAAGTGEVVIVADFNLAKEEAVVSDSV
jgi:polysaccharide transporter, PST family